MASPPTPPPLPPPDYFTKKAAAAAAAAPPTNSSSSIVPAPSTPMAAALSYTDTIADVTPFIPITLDLAAHNYYRWRHLFEVHLGRCNLRSHVAENSVPQPDNPQWVKDDLAIIQWIYTRVSTEIFNLIFHDAATAANLWAALR